MDGWTRERRRGRRGESGTDCKCHEWLNSGRGHDLCSADARKEKGAVRNLAEGHPEATRRARPVCRPIDQGFLLPGVRLN